MKKDELEFIRNAFEKAKSNGQYEEMEDIFEKLLSIVEIEQSDVEKERASIKEINFEIDIEPFSTNRMNWIGLNKKTGMRMIIPTKEYDAFKQAGLYALQSVKDKFEKEQIGVELTFGTRYPLKHDLDNYIKPTLDLIAKKGYIKDDRYIFEIIARKVASKDGFIKGTLYEL